MARGHKIDDVSVLPLVLTDDIESISKTRDLKNILFHSAEKPKSIGAQDQRIACIIQARNSKATRK